MDRFGKGTAFADLSDVPFFDNKGWTAVSGDLRITLFKTFVLRNPMESITTDDDGTTHYLVLGMEEIGPVH